MVRIGRPPKLVIEDRWCPICDALLVRKPDESRSNFQRRKTCGMECGQLATHRKQTRELPSRTCVICGETITRHDGEQTTHFLKRKTCGDTCRYQRSGPNTSRTLAEKRIDIIGAIGDKSCEVCGAPIVYKSGEWTKRFENRRTCGKRCTGLLSIANVRRDLHGETIPADYPAEWREELKTAIRERDSGLCRACNRPPLPTRSGNLYQHHVHHIDWNKGNCDPGNLITLCPYCHRRAHRKAIRDEWRLFLEGIMSEEQVAA